MSNLTKNLITQNINYNNTVVTNNPIISRELSILSKEKLNNFEKKIFSKKSNYLCWASYKTKKVIRCNSRDQKFR